MFIYSKLLSLLPLVLIVFSTCLAVESSGSENLKSSAVIPPPTVLDRVLKDLFHERMWLYLAYHFIFVPDRTSISFQLPKRA